ncbi:sulfite exporter TauE/SafE family protein [Teredinibacter turnerae]|uniref:sulfite exporter TauE/SafE family protein n=1 Tax=Teredinibacter turnerae TaxID=2426 RepID=UPI00035D980B|nr:sulfite exporter TauE/SafE family protein [Teredinibacter turnerae]
MTEWLPIIAALIATGALAGLLAGLLGVGGGIVIVPVLYFIFQLIGISAPTAMTVATGTSLLIIIPTSVSSIRAHHKRGNIDSQLVRLWWPFIVLGVVVGVVFATEAGGQVAAIIFGIVAILVAANMMFRANAQPLFTSLPGKLWQSMIAAVIGLVSVVMGIGGGTLGVPTLSACNFPAHRAVGTAAVFGFIIALPGAALLLVYGTTPPDAPLGTIGVVNLLGFAVIVPLTVLMAPVGVKLGAMLNDVLLKRTFAVFLCLSGARMVYQAVLAS